MAQADIAINGRLYKVTCDDGQEQRLQQLANYFDRHVTRLSGELGQIGDARLMLLAALTVCDELFETRKRLADLEAAGAPLDPESAGAARRALEEAADRVEALARRAAEG
ncbi:cell division protein ZapA [Amphiplicatus metriothermophilus]|uniref:Cell division protein ZapA n=1 Tax=Amphiplicatus metriothermophilus TaxID=1519374 RepID=A0A239PYD1_9PROT|nr:cell division protein ZapA [Amphiplicatus metriothermophilus]MBB5518157.1 cell division protein ZapA [Amphiplicatus metriothermophilus]SNT75319.1 cell division protein ZapA [Amphiplicatus metriothermophilus]